MLDPNTQVRSGYILNQYQHSARVHTTIDKPKLDLVGSYMGLIKPNEAQTSLYQHMVSFSHFKSFA
jgi:hypothetical protein